MKIIDNVYGGEEINELVLIDLINSKEIQRLKGISQFGLPERYYHIPIYSRYEHSLGVLILLRRLGADLDEQMAGLLHDISHTAFSHVVDWVIGDPTKEDYQDNIYKEILENSEVPSILMKHGIDYKKITNLDDFSLLEKQAPSLCADRIDYTLRELQKRKLINIIPCLNDLANHNGQVVFKTKETAIIFAEEYIRLQNEHWGGDQARARYYVLAEILKKALETNIISLKDLNKTDEEIIQKLKESFNEEIRDKFELLRNGLVIKEVEGEKGILLEKKFRYVDPEVLMDCGIKKLSEISEGYSGKLEREKQNSKIKRRIIILK